MPRQPRKKKLAENAPIDPADLAAGYMFPDLFADEPLVLRSQEATERPFAPSAAVQYTIPDLPPVDWEHVRKKQQEAARARRRRRQTRNLIDEVFKPRIVIEPIEGKDAQR